MVGHVSLSNASVSEHMKNVGRRKGTNSHLLWLDGITDSMDMNLSELRELVMDKGGLGCCNSWGRKELDTTEQLN